jgi:hypothetical protein
MGKSKPKMEVVQYYLSEHFGICAHADALLRIRIKEKDAWAGEQLVEGAISIDKPELFGGIKKEGGAQGTAYYLPGNSDQVLPDALAVKLGRANGADCPGFRGLASLFFYGSPGFYWTANTPYLPTVDVTVRRVLTSTGGAEQWYPNKARIESGVTYTEGETSIEVVGVQSHTTTSGLDVGPIAFALSGGLEDTPIEGDIVIITIFSCANYNDAAADVTPGIPASEDYETLFALDRAGSLTQLKTGLGVYWKVMGPPPDASWSAYGSHKNARDRLSCSCAARRRSR